MITLSVIFWILFVIGVLVFILRNRNADTQYIIHKAMEWLTIGILGYVVFEGFFK